MSTKLIVEYGGAKSRDSDLEVLGYEVTDLKDLVKTIEYIKGAKIKMNIVARFFNVYELGPIVHDTHSLNLLRDRDAKEARHKEYLKLKQEFDGS